MAWKMAFVCTQNISISIILLFLFHISLVKSTKRYNLTMEKLFRLQDLIFRAMRNVKIIDKRQGKGNLHLKAPLNNKLLSIIHCYVYIKFPLQRSIQGGGSRFTSKILPRCSKRYIQELKFNFNIITRNFIQCNNIVCQTN